MTEAEKEETKAAQTALFNEVRTFCCDKKPDLAVCDELIGACALGLVPEEEVRRFLQEKPTDTEVVLTGRNPSQALVDLADYVSEIKKIKHPFDKGIPARLGIEE